MTMSNLEEGDYLRKTRTRIYVHRSDEHFQVKENLFSRLNSENISNSLNSNILYLRKRVDRYFVRARTKKTIMGRVLH